MIWWWAACTAADPGVVEEPAAPTEPVAERGPDELLPGPDRALVVGHCTACHSASVIRQNHLSRDQWDDTITWMQDTQGLWALSADHRARVLDYLVATQGPLVEAADLPWAHPRYEPNPIW